jgi:hypothetical protein
LVVALAAAACSGGGGPVAPEGGEAGGQHLVPAWEPEGATGEPTLGGPTGGEAPLAGAGAGDAEAPGAEPAEPTEQSVDGGAPPTSGQSVAPASASLSDPEGDVTGSPVERPPAWVDLLGATLTRSTEGWELRVRVAGGQAPDSSGSQEHTMNLAFFADLDGDGAVDAQIWANLADHGWGAGWFPPEPPNRFGEASEVTITPEGDEVVLRFPASHLPAERLRWSVAAEWGRFEALGTAFTARDRAPDAGPAHFP